MNLKDRILSAIGLQTKSTLPSSVQFMSDGSMTLWGSNKKESADRALSLYKGWVYACVRAIAEEMAAIELELYKKGTGKAGKYERIEDGEVLDLLYGVNPQMTGYELFFLTAAHLELAGNCYWHLEGVSSDTGKPTAIYILSPKYVRVIKDREGKTVLHYEYRKDGVKREYQPYEILHLKYPDPNDSLEGIGTVQAITDWVEADNAATDFNKQFFQNGTRIGGYLESETATTAEQLDYLKRSFSQAAAGLQNAYKTLALPKGTVFKPGQESTKDMDFANMMQVMRDKILAGFRVPKPILGIVEDVNRANAEATHYVFMSRTIKPKMRQFVAQINEFLLPRYGDGLWIDFADPTPANREQEIAEMGVASDGILSPDEKRERYFGMGPVQGGDAVRVGFGTAPLGSPIDKKAVGRLFVKRQKKSGAHARKEISDDIAEKMESSLKAIDKQVKEIKTKSVADLTDEEYLPVWKAMVNRLQPYELKIASDMRGLNSRQKAEVLERLPNAVKTKAISPSSLFDKAKWIGLTVDVLNPTMRDLMAKEGKQALTMLGLADFDFMTPEVSKALTDSLEYMSDRYSDETIALLQAKLEEGISGGYSLDELTKAVSDVYQFRDDVGAARVAKTEVFRVANDANKTAWRESGVVKTIKWYTAGDPCEFCIGMNGKVIGVEDDFFKQGDTITGADGKKLDLDYSDVGTPPLHPNCRCYLRPETIDIS